MEGPAASLFASGVSGGDLVDLTHEALVQDLRLSPFAAREVLAARNAALRL